MTPAILQPQTIRKRTIARRPNAQIRRTAWRGRGRESGGRGPGPADVSVASFDGMLVTLCHALRARDAYTWEHSRRVSRYAGAMASAMGMAPDDAAEIVLGARLHDLGKIGVSDELLHKTGALSPQEYRVVSEHTVIGERILAPVLGDHPLALGIVRWHHERVDGHGLPDGLAGDHIPLGARIVGVADAFDAMTSRRPYRSPLTDTAALEELSCHAGEQFDANCVRALVELASRGGLDCVGGAGSEGRAVA